MTTYCTVIDSPKEPKEVFEYMATFSNARDWDPSVVEAEALTPGQANLGSQFRLGVRVAGRVTWFDYTVVAIDRPKRVVLRAESGLVASTDTIEVEPLGSGTRMRYYAVLDPRGPLRLAGPLVGRSFGKMADRAAAGLRGALA